MLSQHIYMWYCDFLYRVDVVIDLTSRGLEVVAMILSEKSYLHSNKSGHEDWQLYRVVGVSASLLCVSLSSNIPYAGQIPNQPRVYCWTAWNFFDVVCCSFEMEPCCCDKGSFTKNLICRQLPSLLVVVNMFVTYKSHGVLEIFAASYSSNNHHHKMMVHKSRNGH